MQRKKEKEKEEEKKKTIPRRKNYAHTDLKETLGSWKMWMLL